MLDRRHRRHMRRFLHNLLARLARRTVRAYRPFVIGVTGSVGKTSTRDAIVAALGSTRRVWAARGSYNNDLGLPLTVLGEEAAGRSPWRWLCLLWRGWVTSCGGREDYPKYLVLEYGADRRGDIARLTRMVRPHVAVVTAVAPAHTEFFGTLDDVAQEKSELVRALSPEGVAVLCAWDERVLAMRPIASGAVVTYGLGASADVRAQDIHVDIHNDGAFLPGIEVVRLRADIVAAGDRGELVVRDCLGDAHLRSLLSGIAVALQCGVSLAQAVQNVASYTPPPGRMRLVAGIKHTLLLDDSYNASPASMHAALETIASVPLVGRGRRFVVLGDMLELGRYAQTAHADVGRHVASLPVDWFIAVGELARDMARSALEAGFAQDRVVTYARAADAGRFLQQRLNEGDVVLVKGSQGVRMERIVKELMAEPLRAPELLVRQSASWLAKP